MEVIFLLVSMLWAATSWSYTVSGSTYVTNGSQSDVQAACSAAPDNGTVTVVIPNGTYTWSGSLNVTKALTLCGASATGVKINNALPSGLMIAATSSANGNVNIYWLNIVQAVNAPSSSNNGQLGCNRVEPSNYTVLIHDCTFDTAGYWTFAIMVYANGIIFWNDSFPNTGGPTGGAQSANGIDFVCDKYGFTSSWNTPDSFGIEDTTGLMNSYVENCSFTNGTSSAVNCEDNARVVWRNNTMQDALFSSHGQDTGAYGVREMEVYNNTFTLGPNAAAMGTYVSFNGGTGIVFGNSLQDLPGRIGVQLNVYAINRVDSIPCQIAYPAARQVGQGWSVASTALFGNPVVTGDGTGAIIDPIYVWNNTGTETAESSFVSPNQFSPDECGDGKLISEFLQKGRDYFVGTAKPNYTPYTYPHPLHTKFAVGNPSPTPTPISSPTPTPISKPTPTPTPTLPHHKRHHG